MESATNNQTYRIFNISRINIRGNGLTNSSNYIITFSGVGNIGSNGATGAQGATGVTGAQGRAGGRGIEGPRGNSGAQGATGNQGANGFDANSCTWNYNQNGSIGSGDFNYNNELTIFSISNTDAKGNNMNQWLLNIKIGDYLIIRKVNNANDFGTGRGSGSPVISISGGKLIVSDDQALGAAVGDGSIRIQDNAVLRFSGSTTLDSNRGIELDTGGGKIEVDSGFTAVVPSNISGSSAFEKLGAGSLQLKNNNSSLTSSVTVSDGTLTVDGINPAIATCLSGATSNRCASISSVSTPTPAPTPTPTPECTAVGCSIG